ncbi:MAG: cytochrome P450, partial [Anaerolineae bacterium]|nr:cytochrome P450 [Anaerolineae bacterium]
QYGEVFAIQLGTKPAVVLIGPEKHEQFFNLTDKNLSMREAYQWLIPMFGELLFAAPTHEDYLEQRRMMSPILSGRKMAGYIAQMDREITDWIASQPDSGTFELNDFAQFITMFTAARCFMGDEFREAMGEEFAALYRDIARGIDFLLPTYLPLPKFIARDRAKARLHELVNDLIAHRHGRGDEYNDFIQEMIDARMDNGEPMPPEMITGAIIGFMFAGYETTSAHLTWAIIRLLQHPDYVPRLLVPQVDAVLGEEAPVTPQTLRALEYLHWVVMEIERTDPAASMMMRYVREGFDVEGYHIPAGWMAMISPAFAHRLPRVFSDPDTFDPERFSPERAEHKRHSHALVGFGGGLHKCWGMSFANNEITLILARLFQAFELSLEKTGEVAIEPGQQIARPKSPFRIRFRRRAL